MSKVVAVSRRLGADLLCLALAAGLASGCYTVQRIPPNASGARQLVRTGDKVRIVTREGVQLDLVAVTITKDGLVGNPPGAEAAPITVPFSRIETMEKLEYSETKSLGAAAGAAAFLGAVTVISFVVLFMKIDSEPSGPPGPWQRPAQPAAP